MGKDKIWIDLDNSPHVLFFKPIIRALEEKGYEVFITARDAFQVKDLLKQLEIPARLIGRHHGKNKILKAIGLLLRALELLPAVIKENPAWAVSHGSRAQMILTRLLGIRTILILDYEFVKLIPFALPDYMIVPEVVSAGRFRSRGIRVLHYPGIKEDVYLPLFIPNQRILEDLGSRDEHKIIVTVRGPATEAHYFIQESEELFEKVVDYLSSMENVVTVILPRNMKRYHFIKNRWAEECA